MTLLALVGPGHTDDDGRYVEAETLLRLSGFRVVNPAKRRLIGATRLSSMRHDLAALIECDGAATLPGWTLDLDAVIQVRLIQDLGLSAMPVSGWLDQGPEEDVNG